MEIANALLTLFRRLLSGCVVSRAEAAAVSLALAKEIDRRAVAGQPSAEINEMHAAALWLVARLDTPRP